MIRAKFTCREVAKYASGAEQVKLSAVTDRPGNESWSKYTPYGDLTISITNPAAQGKFAPGKDYFLDFTPVEE